LGTKHLEKAIHTQGKPEIFNSNQGTQFLSDVYINHLTSLETVKISIDGQGRARDNASIEGFFRTIKHDLLYLNPSRSRHGLFAESMNFINYYNHQTSHYPSGRSHLPRYTKKNYRY